MSDITITSDLDLMAQVVEVEVTSDVGWVNFLLGQRAEGEPVSDDHWGPCATYLLAVGADPYAIPHFTLGFVRWVDDGHR